MPFLPTARIRIQPFFGYRNRERLTLTVRALRSRVHAFEKTSSWRAFHRMIAQFASHEVPGLVVTLELVSPSGERSLHQAQTDDEGYARFDIALDGGWPYAARPEWETVTLTWHDGRGPGSIDGHVLVPGERSALGVISDIDDTIIETGITGNVRAMLRNWRRVLLEMPAERLAVPGADVLYSALGGGAADETAPHHAGAHQQASRRPFFYVSSSPWNLYSYLVAYMQLRGLPLGPIMLRDWGLNRATFGSASHGAHKVEAIAAILDTYRDMRFALLGDDSQGDLTAFAALAAAHPGRIRAIFVRKVGETMTAAEDAAQAAIEAAGIPLWLGAGYDRMQDFLAAIGLDDDQDAQSIAATVEAPAAVSGDARDPASEAQLSVPVQRQPG